MYQVVTYVMIGVYVVLLLSGFCNIVLFLIGQDRYKQPLLCWFYFLVQTVLVIRIISFVYIQKVTDIEEREWQIVICLQFLLSTFRLMCGSVQLAEMVELDSKMKIINNNMEIGLQTYCNKRRPKQQCALYLTFSLLFITCTSFITASLLGFNDHHQLISTIAPITNQTTYWTIIDVYFFQVVQQNFIVFMDYTGTVGILIGVSIFCAVWSLQREMKQHDSTKLGFAKANIGIQQWLCLLAYAGCGIYCIVTTQAIKERQMITSKDQLAAALAWVQLFDLIASIFDLPNVICIFVTHIICFRESNQQLEESYVIAYSQTTQSDEKSTELYHSNITNLFDLADDSKIKNLFMSRSNNRQVSGKVSVYMTDSSIQTTPANNKTPGFNSIETESYSLQSDKEQLLISLGED